MTIHEKEARGHSSPRFYGDRLTRRDNGEPGEGWDVYLTLSAVSAASLASSLIVRSSPARSGTKARFLSFCTTLQKVTRGAQTNNNKNKRPRTGRQQQKPLSQIKQAKMNQRRNRKMAWGWAEANQRTRRRNRQIDKAARRRNAFALRATHRCYSYEKCIMYRKQKESRTPA